MSRSKHSRLNLRFICICLTTLSCAAISVPTMAENQLPAMSIDINKTSVSGLSSGAFMTSQFYVANSDIMVGAGIIAGGPYLCAQSWSFQSYMANATTTCMNPLTKSSGPNTPSLIKKTRELAANHKIDDLDNLKNDKIYLFSGKDDKTVVTNVVNQTEQFFLDLGVPTDSILYNTSVDAGHAIITSNPDDTQCNKTQPPFINDCDFEQSHRIMRHIYGDLNPPSDNLSSSIVKFDQTEFIDAHFTSMSDDAYVYIPKSCQTETCKLHVVLHGCEQGAKVIGDDYYANTGYNEIADSNNFIMLFPQVQPSNGNPLNPEGCWDFWGYSSPQTATPDYFTKSAPQLRAIRAMVDRLAEKTAMATSVN